MSELLAFWLPCEKYGWSDKVRIIIRTWQLKSISIPHELYPLIAAFCSLPEEEVLECEKEEFEREIELYNNKKIEEAIVIVKCLLHANPCDAQYHNGYACCLQGLQEYREAELYYQKAVALSKGEEMLYIQNYFRILITKLGKLNEGGQLLDTYDMLSKNEWELEDSRFLYDYGLYFGFMRDFERSKIYFERGFNAIDDYTLGINNYAYILYLNQEFDEALTKMNSCIELTEKKEPWYLWFKGEILFEIGRLKESQQCFTEALALNDRDINSLLGLLRIQLEYAKHPDIIQKQQSLVVKNAQTQTQTQTSSEETEDSGNVSHESDNEQKMATTPDTDEKQEFSSSSSSSQRHSMEQRQALIDGYLKSAAGIDSEDWYLLCMQAYLSKNEALFQKAITAVSCNAHIHYFFFHHLHTVYYYYALFLQYEMKDIARAKHMYLDILSQYRNKWSFVFYQLALCEFELKSYQSSLSYLEQAYEYNPRFHVIANNYHAFKEKLLYCLDP